MEESSKSLTPLFEMVECNYCNHFYKRSTKKRNSKLGNGVRGRNTLTCSPQCSKDSSNSNKKIESLHKRKMHYLDGEHYLCNKACSITKSKCTINPDQVNCMNCLDKIKKGKYSNDDN